MAVAAAKIIYGYKTDSISMLSDGFHSLFDGTSNVVGLVGVWVASHPPDENHPYGHRKYETLSTIAIAALIFMTGIEILKKVYHGLTVTHNIEVTSLSFSIMLVTLLVNIWVMLYERKKGRELKSDFLLADAMHTTTDIYVSISVIISLIAVKMGYPLIDAVVAFIIVIFITRMGFEILKSAADVLTDTAQISPDKIRKVIDRIKDIKGCHGIRTRGKQGAVNVDLHIQIHPDVTTGDAHELAHSVEDAIKKEFPSVIDVVIHTEPYRHKG